MKKMLFAINVDWYFNLHWRDRVLSYMSEGFDVCVCYGETEGTPPENDINTHTYVLHRSSVSPLSNLKTFFSCLKIVKAYQPKIIHSVTIKPNIFFGLIAHMKKIPILIVIPGLGSVFSSKGLKYKCYRKIVLMLYKFIGKNRCYFIFENPDDKLLFVRQDICSDNNSMVSPGAGVDINEFTFSTDVEHSDERIRVLFAARLIYGKGLEDLVQAIEILNKQKQYFQLDVAGIFDHESTEAISESQILAWEKQGKINWLGQVSDMPSLLCQVNIVALPTTYAEGLPRILLEAAAAGRAIIATDSPGCNSLIEHNYNGQLVRQKDIEQLVSALKSYQSRDLRVLHGTRNRELIENKFTMNHVINCYQKAYEILLRESIE